MTVIANNSRGGHGWQLILADLALILFLLTLSALPAAEATGGQRLADTDATERTQKAASNPRLLRPRPCFALCRGGPAWPCGWQTKRPIRAQH